MVSSVVRGEGTLAGIVVVVVGGVVIVGLVVRVGWFQSEERLLRGGVKSRMQGGGPGLFYE